jgi:hypothetical protein
MTFTGCGLPRVHDHRALELSASGANSSRGAQNMNHGGA